jgi:hypothetical protein
MGICYSYDSDSDDEDQPPLLQANDLFMQIDVELDNKEDNNNKLNEAASEEIEVRVIIADDEEIDNNNPNLTNPSKVIVSNNVSSNYERVASRVHRLKSIPPPRPSKLNQLNIKRNGTVTLTKTQAQQLAQQKILIFNDYIPTAKSDFISNSVNRSNKAEEKNCVVTRARENTIAMDKTEKSNKANKPENDANVKRMFAGKEEKKYLYATLKLNKAATIKLEKAIEEEVLHHNTNNISNVEKNKLNEAVAAAKARVNQSLHRVKRSSIISMTPCVIQSIRCEYAATHGLYFHITGTKPAHLIIHQAWIDLQGEEFWNCLCEDQAWAIRMAIKMFRRRMPMKLCPKKMNPADYQLGHDKFTTTIAFGVENKGMNNQLSPDKLKKSLTKFINSKLYPNPLILIQIRYSDDPNNHFYNEAEDNIEELIQQQLLQDNPHNPSISMNSNPTQHHRSSSITKSSGSQQPRLGKSLFQFFINPQQILNSLQQNQTILFEED